MFEYEVLFTDGHTSLLFGYSLADALRRSHKQANEVAAILYYNEVEREEPY